MSRRLSTPEWLEFQNAVDVDALDLPPWGGVAHWGEQLILIYICPGTGTLCHTGEVMLTDVTDHAELLRNIPRTYDATQGLWYYHLPSELMGRFLEVAHDTLTATGKIVQTAVNLVEGTAEGLTSVAKNLTPILLAALVALVFLNIPHGSR